MDGRRFDELARGLAGPSRRGLLRGFGAAAIGGVLARIGLQEAAAACKKYGRPCSSSTQCCSGTCTGGICRCGPEQVTCNASGGPVCVSICPDGQVMAANCTCVCEATGHPPVDGACPTSNICPPIICEVEPPLCGGFGPIPCFCVPTIEGDDACIFPIPFDSCDSSADCFFQGFTGVCVDIGICIGGEGGPRGLCFVPCDQIPFDLASRQQPDQWWPPQLP
jgi:hypothetical protein